MLDSEKVEIAVSGSSARLLSREIHTSLRGRELATVIRPLSFRELLAEGGFPEAQGLAPALRIELLQGYVDTVFFRDVVERYSVSQVAALRWLVRQCLRNPAGSFSAHRLHQDLKSQGHGVARDAVHAMLGHLLDAFLLSAVPLATESERRRNSNPRKIYPADAGLIQAFDASGRTNVGRGSELIQVSADPSAPDTLARELRALVEAAGEHPRATKRLVVLDRDAVVRVRTPGVLVRPAYEWLLADPSCAR